MLLTCALAQAGDLLIQVEGLQDSGLLHLALVGGDQRLWSEPPLRQQSAAGDLLRLSDLPPGRYAIQLFQDVNGNGRLDQSLRGIPREPVGFSANPPLLRGKPTPEAAAFSHGEEDSRLTIRLYQPKARR